MNARNVHVNQDFWKKHIPTIAVGILAIIYVWWSYLPEGVLLAPLSTTNVIRLVLFGSFFLLLIFADQPRHKLFVITNSVLMPVSAMLIFLYILIDAVGADGLAREERLIEDFSFIFLMVSTVCMLTAAFKFGRAKRWLAVAVAALLAIVFFVIGMEEISWFQHVMEYDSNEFFRERNSQGETNLHNLYSHESEDIFYFGGFLLLVVFPYFRNQIIKMLDKIGLAALTPLVPAYWLLAPTALAGAFVAPFFLSRSANATIAIGSLVILIGAARQHLARREWWRFGQMTFTGMLFVSIIAYLLSFKSPGQDVRAWIGKEYQEFYIAWGIVAYAVSALVAVWQSGSKTGVTARESSTQQR